MGLKQLIREYLQEARLMQVATTKNDQPWVCSVYFAFDEDLNLYWLSKKDSRHSQELEENGKVAGTIVLPYSPGQKVRGIQFQGIGNQTTGENLQKAVEIYAKRMGMNEERKQNILEGKDGHMPYVIKPTMYVLFDEVNFPDNPRQKLAL